MNAVVSIRYHHARHIGKKALTQTKTRLYQSAPPCTSLIRVCVIPRFTNQSIDLYHLSYYLHLIILPSKTSKDVPSVRCNLCRYCDYAIRFVYGTNRAIQSRSFPSSTWVHIHVTCTRRLNVSYSTRAANSTLPNENN